MSGERGGLPVSARRGLVVGVILTVLMWTAYLIVTLMGVGEGLVLLLVRVLAVFVFAVSFGLAGRGIPTTGCGPAIGWLREKPGRRWMTVVAFVSLYVLVNAVLGGRPSVLGFAGDWLRVLLIGVEAYLLAASGSPC